MPAVRAGCGDSLAEAVEVEMTRRQVIDLPEPKPQVTQHHLVTMGRRGRGRPSGIQPGSAAAILDLFLIESRLAA